MRPLCVPNHLIGRRVRGGRILLVQIIGEGAYGCVYLGIMVKESPPRQCAVKVVETTNLDEYHTWVRRREVSLHRHVSKCEGVVSLYEAFYEDDWQFLVMEYCTGGDLWDAIAVGRYENNSELIADTFVQILDAVEFCHSKRVFHRDIKPENILLDEGGRKVLLADFGLASGSLISTEMRCGSPWYMSPECWGIDSSGPYATAPNDVWALGILLINIACGRHAPWAHATSRDSFFRDFIRRPDILGQILPLSREGHAILVRIFTIDPAHRITIPELRRAVRNTRHLLLPLTERRGTLRTPRAVDRSLSPVHPFSPAKPLRLMVVTSHHRIESVDITASSRSQFPYLLDLALPPLPSNIRDSPAVGERRRLGFIPPFPALSALHLSSISSMSSLTSPLSGWSTQSKGPITPGMVPTRVDIAVPDIVEVSSSDPPDERKARQLDDEAKPPAMHIIHEQRIPVRT